MNINQDVKKSKSKVKRAQRNEKKMSSTITPATSGKRQVACAGHNALQGSTSTLWQRRRPKPKRLRVLSEEEEEEEEEKLCPHQATEGLKNDPDGNNSNDNNQDDEEYKMANTAENVFKDAYEFNHLQFLNSMNLRSNLRPLPAISTMIAVASQQQQREGSSSSGTMVQTQTAGSEKLASDRSKIPLLKDFFNSLRDKVGLEESRGGGEIDDDDTNEETEPKQIDENNQNVLSQISTILTHGHHKRFRELLIELEKDGLYPDGKQRKKQAFRNRRARRKEFQKLCDLFKEERDLYADALEKFKDDNVDKFLIGFKVPGPAADFVHVNAEKAKKWSERWNAALEANLVSNCYGPYTQAISLHGAGQKNFETMEMHTFNPKIVHRDIDGLVKVKADWMQGLRKQKRLKPRFVTEPPSILLIQDGVAKSLALKHNADIVVTSSALEALMKHPEDPNTSWKIPMFVVDVGVGSSKKLVLFMEDQLPSMSTPRECLSVGICEGLISQVLDTEIHCNRVQGKYTYTLITVPHFTGNQRVLVRSCNYVVNEDDEPLLLLSQLEYFVGECGMEEFGSYDRALWLLYKILQGNSRTVVGRVDAISTEVLEAEEKTIADSLAVNDACVPEKFLDSLGYFDKKRTDINSSFRVMATILSAALLVEKKVDARYIICFPGLGHAATSQATATVHRAQEDETKAVINIKKEVDSNASAVLLTKGVLYSCFNQWQWKFDRFPYTFPIEGQG